jgi:hypothetical protein
MVGEELGQVVAVGGQDGGRSTLDGLRGDQRIRHVASARAAQELSGPAAHGRLGRGGADRIEHPVDRCIARAAAEGLGENDNRDDDGEAASERPTQRTTRKMCATWCQGSSRT